MKQVRHLTLLIILNTLLLNTPVNAQSDPINTDSLLQLVKEAYIYAEETNSANYFEVWLKALPK